MSESSPKDPLESASSPDRVFYAVGKLLRAEDFNTEQNYHRGRLALSLAYLNGTGTVAGLKVEYQGPRGPAEEIVVRAGIALDRIGRIIEVPNDAFIRLQDWYVEQAVDELDKGFHASAGGVLVDVFVRFDPCEHSPIPACPIEPFDATETTLPSRIRDGYKLELVIRKEGTPSLPVNAWQDFAADASAKDRAKKLHDAIFARWHEGINFRDENGILKPLPEHAVGQDTTSLFLARFILPATAGSPPVRTSGPVSIDNDSRLFACLPCPLMR